MTSILSDVSASVSFALATDVGASDEPVVSAVDANTSTFRLAVKLDVSVDVLDDRDVDI